MKLFENYIRLRFIIVLMSLFIGVKLYFALLPRSMLPAEKLEGYVPRFSNNTQPSEGCLGDWSPIIFGTADWPKPVVIVPPPASKANTVASRKVSWIIYLTNLLLYDI